MGSPPIRTAPNYTTACIVMFGVNIVWMLMAIWAIWGLIAAMLLGVGVNHVLNRARAWSTARAAASIRRGKQA